MIRLMICMWDSIDIERQFFLIALFTVSFLITIIILNNNIIIIIFFFKYHSITITIQRHEFKARLKRKSLGLYWKKLKHDTTMLVNFVIVIILLTVLNLFKKIETKGTEEWNLLLQLFDYSKR